MTKEQALEQVIDIANHNMDWFIGIISVLVGFFAIFQWYFNDKQLEKVKEDMRREYKGELTALSKKLQETMKIKSKEGEIYIKSPRTFNSHIREIEGNGLTIIDFEIGFSWSYNDGDSTIYDFIKTSINDYYLSGKFQIISTDDKASAYLVQEARTGNWNLIWNRLPESDGLYSFDFHHVWVNPAVITNRQH